MGQQMRRPCAHAWHVVSAQGDCPPCVSQCGRWQDARDSSIGCSQLLRIGVSVAVLTGSRSASHVFAEMPFSARIAFLLCPSASPFPGGDVKAGWGSGPDSPVHVPVLQVLTAGRWAGCLGLLPCEADNKHPRRSV